jgi:serine/threonine-protein kinase HipA
MAKNEIISVFCFGVEIGRVGFDEDKKKSFFQFNADYLDSGVYPQLFPETGIVKRTKQTQVFSRFGGETFRGLMPMLADSLPDMFGNIVFQKWLEATNKEFKQISVLEQLTYVGDRGMGALEFKPSKRLKADTTIDLSEIIEVLKDVLTLKSTTASASLRSKDLLNIFKIGTSAGGARPKILVSEHKITGEIVPGDAGASVDFNHYLVKLGIDDNIGYSREAVEYSYYLTARHLGIRMMPSKMIDNMHFATLRFDRENGGKKHVLTASGLTGWDYRDERDSSYENLFELVHFLKLTPAERQELFTRMVFNVVFANTDDHMKNHAFIYDEKRDQWGLSPAYDLTYALNPLFNYTRSVQALSVNGKRMNIELEDLLAIAEKYTIKNAKNTIREVCAAVDFWQQTATDLKLPSSIVGGIRKSLVIF